MAGTTSGPTRHDPGAAAPAHHNDAVLRAIHEHHANLGHELADLVSGVLAAARTAYGHATDTDSSTDGAGTAAAGGNVTDVTPAGTADDPTDNPGADPADAIAAARGALSAFLRDELLPHAAAEEQTLYAAAAGDPLVASLTRAMIDEHGVLTELADRVAGASDPVTLVAAAGAVRTLFAVHAHKENAYLLPALDTAGTDLETLLSGMHRMLTGSREEDCGHDH